MRNFFVTKTHEHVLFFTNKGRVYRLRGYEIPDTTRQARGTALVNLLTLPPGEEVTAAFPIDRFEGEKYLVMVTKHGVIKKTKLEEFANVRRNGLIAINLDESDELLAVDLSNGSRDIILASTHGMAVHFNEKDVRPMGRVARGVKAMTLDKGDTVVAMDVIEDDRREVLARYVARVRQAHADRRVPPHVARRQGRKGVRAPARRHRSGRRPDSRRARRPDSDDHVGQSGDSPQGPRHPQDRPRREGRATSAARRRATRSSRSRTSVNRPSRSRISRASRNSRSCSRRTATLRGGGVSGEWRNI